MKIILGVVKNREIDSDKLPNQIKICDINSLSWEFHLLTSKIWIDNHRKNFWKKRKETFYLNTWHGGGMIKKIEKDAEESLTRQYIDLAKNDSKAIDLLLSDCSRMTRFFKESFWYKGKVIECGLPRYKPFIENDYKVVLKVRSVLKIPSDYGIVLYSPTFRKNQTLDAYSIDSDMVLKACKKRFGKSFVFLSRLHPNLIDKFKCIFKNSQDVIDVSFYDDIQELLAASDIVISDFSSTIYDFTFTKKPAFRFITDVNDYIKDRDTNFPLDFYPWPLAKDNTELFKEIIAFDSTKYKNKIDKFFSLLGVHIEKNPDVLCAELLNDYICGLSKKELFRKYDYLMK